MRNIAFTLIAFAAIVAYSCQGTPNETAHRVDLLEYGIPINIEVPVDSPAIKTEDWIIKQSVNITANEDYDLQIFYQDAKSSDLVSIKATELADVKSNRYFSSVVEENEAGFIYESKIDSTNVNYGFRHILLQGNKEYVFQQNLIGSFDLASVQQMYKAAQEVK